MTEVGEPPAGEDKRPQPALRPASFILRRVSAAMRRSDVNYRLLLPLLASGVAVQAVMAVTRVTTS
jgi:hypothetical protein